MVCCGHFIIISFHFQDSNGAEIVKSFTLIINEPDLTNAPQFSPFPDITIPMVSQVGH